jgi:hypothetical protein
MIEIENKQFLIDRFGRWPSFHDGEVVRVKFEREGPDAPFMECDIHVFNMTDDVDGSGHYDLNIMHLSQFGSAASALSPSSGGIIRMLFRDFTSHLSNRAAPMIGKSGPLRWKYPLCMNARRNYSAKL